MMLLQRKYNRVNFEINLADNSDISRYRLTRQQLTRSNLKGLKKTLENYSKMSGNYRSWQN